MFGQGHGLELHHVAVVIPQVTEDIDRWTRFAIDKVAERFGLVAVGSGWMEWSNGEHSGEGIAVSVESLTSNLTELDMTILAGIAWSIFQATGIEGVAVKIDDDVLIFS